MPLALLLAILAFPVAEIASMIQVGRWIGLFPTLLLLFLSGAAGVLLIRSQSFSMAGRIAMAVRDGRSPLTLVASSGFVVLAGLLLITPGFVSDVMALLLLLPPVRNLLASRMGGRVQVWRRSGPPYPPQTGPRDEKVIDVDYSEVTPKNEPPSTSGGTGQRPKGPSPWRR